VSESIPPNIENKLMTKLILAVISIWFALAILAAKTAFFLSLPIMLFVITVITLLVALVFLYFNVQAFQRWIINIGLRKLTAFHIWRIGAAALFFWYGQHDLLPKLFVLNAGWGDLIVGILALIVVIVPFNTRNYWIMHVFGFADFVIAVGTGTTLLFMHTPTMDNVAIFPLALIPLFGVPISGATHIMAFHMLQTRSGFGKAQ